MVYAEELGCVGLVEVEARLQEREEMESWKRRLDVIRAVGFVQHSECLQHAS